MHHFAYRGGALHAEDAPVDEIAQAVGTPFYLYSSATLERHYQVFAGAFAGLDALVCFAVKANSNQAVLATLARQGAGADVVSEGELKRALAAGVPAGRIVFSGVGKTAQEMAAGLKAGIYQFNVESEPELELLNEVALSLGLRAPITFRVNPDVDAKTHAKISTGKQGSKFGVAWERARAAYGRAAQLPGVEVVGVDLHIGSQLTDLEPLEAAFTKVRDLILMLRQDGHDIRRADLGGGLGIPYDPDKSHPPLPSDYGRMVASVTRDLGCRLILEPGRLIAGNAGVLVSRVIYVKEAKPRPFVIIDAGMNDLIRPAMYEAYHAFGTVKEPGPERMSAAIAGPVCESSDVFAQEREIPLVQAGDLVVLYSAGAYSAVMSSTYNSRLLTPEVMVRGAQWSVVRPRQDLDALIGLDRLPEWLNN